MVGVNHLFSFFEKNFRLEDNSGESSYPVLDYLFPDNSFFLDRIPAQSYYIDNLYIDNLYNELI